MKPDVCMLCRENNSIGNDLRRLADFLQRLDLDIQNGRRIPLKYYWDYEPRCKFGLTCSKLHSYANQNLDLILRVIEPGIEAVIRSGNERYYHVLLRYLQGRFSRVYTQVEQDWHREQQKEK